MKFRTLQEGKGPKRHLLICYYIGEYADSELKKIVPDDICVINDTNMPTSRYTRISQNHKTGILSLQSTVDWAQKQYGFDADKIIIGAFSAGGQAPRSLLLNSEIPDGIFVADGTHCSEPPALWQLVSWQDYCNLAKTGAVSAVFSHTQITPPTFSSTKKTLRLITKFALDHEGTLDDEAMMALGKCEVWSYKGNNAKAHSKQATVVFCRLLKRTLINLKILKDDITPTEENKVKITNDPATWRCPLEINMKGDDIKEWQKILLTNNHDLGDAGVDGHFGQKTENATMAWQHNKNIAIDGKVGQETIAAIADNICITQNPWLDPTKSLGVRALYFSLSEKAKNVKEIPNGSNSGPEIKEYFNYATRKVKGVEQRLGISSGNWCAVSACYATKQSLLKDDKMPHGYRAGVVELVQDAMSVGNWKTAKQIRLKQYTMQQGDLAIFDRSVPGKKHTSWWRHVARIETEVGSDEKSFRTLGGNENNTYTLTTRDITNKKFLGCIAYPQIVYDIKNIPKPEIPIPAEKHYDDKSTGWPNIIELIQVLTKYFNQCFK